MAVRKQRATTCETYAISTDRKECLAKAKKIHREDDEFYIYQINNCYCSVSLMDFNTNQKYSDEETLEHWIFDVRWRKC